MCNERIKTIYFTTLYSKNVHFHDSSKSANITDIINKSYITIAWNECIVYVCLSKCYCVIICYSTCIYNAHRARSEIFINTFSMHYMFQEFCNTTYLRVTVLWIETRYYRVILWVSNKNITKRQLLRPLCQSDKQNYCEY